MKTVGDLLNELRVIRETLENTTDKEARAELLEKTTKLQKILIDVSLMPEGE